MELPFTQSDAYTPVIIDDHWIIDQLFGIKRLENQLDRALSAGKHNEKSVQRQVAKLKAWVARFDRALDFRTASKSSGQALDLRAS